MDKMKSSNVTRGDYVMIKDHPCRITDISNCLMRRAMYRFTGIDVIGNYLTEINVTSPTGIQEINKLNRVKLEEFFWDRVEKKLR